jgi:hypothetical protein
VANDQWRATAIGFFIIIAALMAAVIVLVETRPAPLSPSCIEYAAESDTLAALILTGGNDDRAIWLHTIDIQDRALELCGCRDRGSK